MKHIFLSFFFFYFLISSKTETIYHVECDTCSHYLLTYSGDSVVKFVRTNIKGDTIYYWDSRLKLFVWKATRKDYESGLLTKKEMDYRFSQWKKNHTANEHMEKMDPLSVEEQREEVIGKEYFFKNNKQYTEVYELGDFKIVKSINTFPDKDNAIRKYYKGRLILKWKLKKNKPYGIVIIYPYSLDYFFDIRLLYTDFDIFGHREYDLFDNHNCYNGISVFYFILPFLFLFFLLWASIRSGWYYRYYYCLLPLIFILFLIACTDYYSYSYFLATIIISLWIILLSLVNLMIRIIGRRTGTVILLNIFFIFYSIGFIFLIYLLKSFEHL